MDKHSKAVLNDLIDQGGCDNIVDFEDGLDSMAQRLHVEPEDLRANVRYLHNEGYLEYVTYQPSGITGAFQLSHKGRYWKDFQFSERMSYIADKWIDFFSMTAAVLALILSVIALLK